MRHMNMNMNKVKYVNYVCLSFVVVALVGQGVWRKLKRWG